MSTAAEPRKKARKPLLSRVPASFVQAVLKGHSSLGLAFAAAIYLICLTGSVAVFTTEFQRWEYAGAPVLETASPQAAQNSLNAAVARVGEVEHAYIRMPAPDMPYLSVSAETPDGTKLWLADGEGALTTEGQSPWTEFITRLHINLHLPQTWGVFLVGMAGVALLSSLISGVLAHPRIFRDAFHLRLGGSKRLQEADLHNRIGIWALPFHIIVSLTGALLGLTTLIVGVLGMALFQGDVSKVYDLFIPAEPVDDPRPAPVIDLLPMFAHIKSVSPEGRVGLVMLEHPAEMGGAAMFNVQSDSGRLADTDTYAFGRDGKAYYTKLASDNNLGEDILASLSRLHFGWFGGGLVKIAYALLGLGMTYLAASGVTIWLARRRDKRNASPGWEKVWAAVIWGQPAALALAALAAALSGAIAVQVLIAIWGAVTVAALIAARWLSPHLLAHWLLLVAGGALALTATAHLVLRGWSDPVALAVDAVFALLGGGLIWWAARRNSAVTPV
ncbi:MAG TPA: PepSY-associated TM helix domain-containing protein [Croceibacterium sp.]|nr:PepSY-associated TM helix domain-containing protein [Croceibacterium sp.]